MSERKGFRYNCVILDEVHVFKTTDLLFAAHPFDLRGTRRRKNPWVKGKLRDL